MKATIVRLVATVVLAVASSGCNLLSDTSPSTTSTQTFSGTLAVRGSNVFTFTATSAGTVDVTLSIIGSSSTLAVGLGIGTPGGTTCTLTSWTDTAVAGSTPQISASEDAGAYCVKIYDVGNLTAATTFSMTVAHP